MDKHITSTTVVIEGGVCLEYALEALGEFALIVNCLIGDSHVYGFEGNVIRQALKVERRDGYIRVEEMPWWKYKAGER